MREQKPFTSQMLRRESVLVLIWLPIHAALLPMLASALFVRSYLTAPQANFMCYAVGLIYMLCVARRFLRRDFDVLCDDVLGLLLHVLSDYILFIACNIMIGLIFVSLKLDANPNNQAVNELAGAERGVVTAMAVFMAPIVEELMFRGGIFLPLRKHSRVAAYAVSALIFSLYHVWGYAVDNPVLWLYTLQYIPVSLILCRCYERTNSIWGCIFLHMLINGVSINTMGAVALLVR